MIRTAVNVSGDAAVSVIVAKSEGKLNQDIYNNPNAGTLTEDDLDIPEEVEQEMAKVIQEAKNKA